MSKIQKRPSAENRDEPALIGQKDKYDRLTAGAPLSLPSLGTHSLSLLCRVSRGQHRRALLGPLQFSFFNLLLEFPSAFHGFSEYLYKILTYLASTPDCPPTNSVLHFQNSLTIYCHLKFNVFRTKLIIIHCPSLHPSLPPSFPSSFNGPCGVPGAP